MAFEQVQFNPFGSGFNAGSINGTSGVQGSPYTGGKHNVGGSAVDRDIADAKRFFGAYNGTGQLQPYIAEANLFCMA